MLKNWTPKPYNIVNRKVDGEVLGIHCRKNLFTNTCLKSQSLYCLNMLAHHDYIQSFEFSDDGKYFLSASMDKCLLLWSMDCAVSNHSKPKPTVFKADYSSHIFSLALGPANDFSFSGMDEKVIVHKIERYNQHLQMH